MATRLCSAESHNQAIKQKESFMKRKLLWAVVLALPLSLGAFAQSDTGGLKQDTKDAAHSTARATKKAGRKVKRGTKKVLHKGAHATRKGADKVEDKTDTQKPPQ